MGWDASDIPGPDGNVMYSMMLVQGGPAAGMGEQPPPLKDAGVPPMWSSYVQVADVDATVAKATDLGGTVLTPAMTVMNSGRMAFLQDPTGAAFGIWQPNEHKGAAWVNSPGGFCWNELYTNDPEKAQTFYEKLFGWSFDANSMGDGVYYSIKNDGNSNGGMMKIAEEWGPMPPNWGVYFTVESLEASVAKAKELGGQNYLPAKTVPEVGTFAGIMDPQGGRFLLIELDGDMSS